MLFNIVVIVVFIVTLLISAVNIRVSYSWGASSREQEDDNVAADGILFLIGAAVVGSFQYSLVAVGWLILFHYGLVQWSGPHFWLVVLLSATICHYLLWVSGITTACRGYIRGFLILDAQAIGDDSYCHSNRRNPVVLNGCSWCGCLHRSNGFQSLCLGTLALFDASSC